MQINPSATSWSQNAPQNPFSLFPPCGARAAYMLEWCGGGGSAGAQHKFMSATNDQTSPMDLAQPSISCTVLWPADGGLNLAIDCCKSLTCRTWIMMATTRSHIAARTVHLFYAVYLGYIHHVLMSLISTTCVGLVYGLVFDYNMGPNALINIFALIVATIRMKRVEN